MATVRFQNAGWTPLPLTAPPQAPGAVPPSTFVRGAATIAFASLLLMNVALSTLKVGGYPLRGLLAVALLGGLFIMFHERTMAAFRQNRLLLLLAAGLAAEGAFVSVVNHAQPQELLSQVIEVHVQTAVTIMVAATLASIAGYKPSLYVIVGVIAVSGCIAVLQMLEIHQAWSWREALGPIDARDMDEFKPILVRRPMGLSYSAIQLATQLCLGFAVYASVREIRRTQSDTTPGADPMIIGALAAFFGLCVASGTRSPILGGLVFFALYSLTRRGSWLPVLIFFGGGLLYFAGPMILSMFQSTQPRVLRVVDNSSDGHLTLAYYGILLFLDNPFGYGLTFHPFEHWEGYWNALYTWPSPTGVQTKELHNYALNMLTTYGIGLLLFVPLVIKLVGRAGRTLIFFVPYVIQIMFHNAGPFWTDTIIWFVIGTIAAAHSEPAANGASTEAPVRNLVPSPRRTRLAPARAIAGPRRG